MFGRKNAPNTQGPGPADAAAAQDRVPTSPLAEAHRKLTRAEKKAAKKAEKQAAREAALAAKQDAKQKAKKPARKEAKAAEKQAARQAKQDAKQQAKQAATKEAKKAEKQAAREAKLAAKQDARKQAQKPAKSETNKRAKEPVAKPPAAPPRPAEQPGPAAPMAAWEEALDLSDPIGRGSDVHALARANARKFGGYLAIVVTAFFVTFFAWASYATLDEITRGDGKVVPTGQNKVVQHLEGGIVAAILVKEGQTVEANQVLMRIESTVSDSALREKLAKYHALLARAARLRAEAEGQSKITFPKEVLESAPNEAAEQKRLFDQRQKRLKSEVDILEQQVAQRRQSLAETKSNVATLSRRVVSLRQELRETEKDYQKGIVSRSELSQIRREYTKAAGELQSERIAVRRAQAALNEVVAKVRDKKALFTAEARKDLAEAESQARTLEPSIRANRGTVERTELRAPVRGIVKQIGVATIGAVIKPGQALVEIVPSDDTLLVEARIKPKDRAFLRPNQVATVKISAYDFSIFGGLEGKVVGISADAIEDEKQKGETYYRIRIRTDKNYLLYQGRRLPIIPGMTASVDIKTGKKTVLDYLFEPIRTVLNESLQER